MKSLEKAFILAISVIVTNFMWIGIVRLVFSKVILVKSVAQMAEKPAFLLTISIINVLFILILKAKERKFKIKNILLFIAGVIMAFLVYSLAAVSNITSFSNFGIDIYKVSELVVAIIISLISISIMALMEEKIFRGYIQLKLDEHLIREATIGISATMYAIFYIVLGASVVGAINMFFVGIILGYMFEATERIHLSLGFNMAYKFLQISIFKITTSKYINIPAIVEFDSGNVIRAEYIVLGVSILLVAGIVFFEKKEQINEFLHRD